MEPISTRATFFWKYVFTALWIVFFGFGTLLGFPSDVPDARPGKWFFLLCWTAGTAFLWWAMGRIKRVRLDGNRLLVSNYFQEVAVPLEYLAEVRRTTFSGSQWPLTLVFAHETPFGLTVRFMPPFRLRLFAENPVAQRLRDASALSRAASAQQALRADAASEYADAGSA